MSKTLAPYGAWRSPITADLLASAHISLRNLTVCNGDLYWIEGRPLEQGRYVIVRRTAGATVTDVTPAGMNARTLVHEYGGGAYVVAKDIVYFCNFADQRIYRQPVGATPTPITPEPPQPRSLRYADLNISPDGRWLVCVRERHEVDGVFNELVVLPVDGSASAQVIASGYDFYSNPRFSPDGRYLAWLCWNNPLMPWDGNELWLAEFGYQMKLYNARHIAGSRDESLFQPEWSLGGALYFISDRSDWWNLYRYAQGEITAVAPLNADFADAQWVFGMSRYTFLSERTIACVYSQNGIDHLALIDTQQGQIKKLESGFTTIGSLHRAGSQLVMLGGSPSLSTVIAIIDPQYGSKTILKDSSTLHIDSAFLSQPEAIEFPTEDGLTAHALYYPPTNALYQASDGELPLLLVTCHGGPTGAANTSLSLEIQYWTSRGIGLVDVNYGGSTGYGRAYRQRLNGNWGLVDVMDCINAARYLIAQGRVDGKRVAIRGGSAGGYTTLRALTWQDFFRAGAAYFPLAELESFVNDTHKFEARYLDSLVGPYPARKDLYFDRSPLNFVDNINAPVALFQGLEDKIVPPSQPEKMVAALKKKGLPHAYLAYEGEQHGFRKAETIIHSTESELSFYGQVFGFDPADEMIDLQVENL